MTSIAVVTPWHGNEWLAEDYMAAVRPELRERDELIIVDNASEPPLRFATFRAHQNLGFSGGSNMGLWAANTDAVLFLNNDIALERSGWLNVLREAVEPGVIAGPMRYDPHTIVDGVPYPYVDGWCLIAMRTDLLELGGFDDTLEEPAYYSDNLLCLNARRAGMTLRDVHVSLRHYGGTTAQRDPNISVVAARNRAKYETSVRHAPAATPR